MTQLGKTCRLYLIVTSEISPKDEAICLVAARTPEAARLRYERFHAQRFHTPFPAVQAVLNTDAWTRRFPRGVGLPIINAKENTATVSRSKKFKNGNAPEIMKARIRKIPLIF